MHRCPRDRYATHDNTCRMKLFHVRAGLHTWTNGRMLTHTQRQCINISKYLKSPKIIERLTVVIVMSMFRFTAGMLSPSE